MNIDERKVDAAVMSDIECGAGFGCDTRHVVAEVLQDEPQFHRYKSFVFDNEYPGHELTG